MDCRHIKSQFSGYLDGDLQPDERYRIQQHVTQCSACQEEYEEVRDFLAMSEDALTYHGPRYTFAELRAKMAAMEPLEELVAFLPSLRVNGAIPRFAVTMVLMLLVCGLTMNLRNTRQVYAAMKSPFKDRVAKLEHTYSEYLDDDSLLQKKANESDSFEV